jgi:hypothetical protein
MPDNVICLDKLVFEEVYLLYIKYTIYLGLTFYWSTWRSNTLRIVSTEFLIF